MRIRIKRLLFYLSFISPAGLIIFGLISPSWEIKRFLIFYMAPLSGCMGIWGYLKIEEWFGRDWQHNCGDFLLIILSIIRLFGLIPVSGHMLFAVYAGIRLRNVYYKGLMTLLMLETSYFKLLVWGDTVSWGYGILFGLLLAIIDWWLKRKIIS